ncbi:putative transposase [Trichonephila clavipes]|nr:putative transposase [Trichonephila clavipes]
MATSTNKTAAFGVKLIHKCIVETPLHPEKLTVWCALWAGGILLRKRWPQRYTRATIDLLKDTFGDRLISRFGPVNWPPRTCDLTPLDYFLWGYVKSLVYADKPQTLDHSEEKIRRVIADMRPQMLEKVIENWTTRLDYIRASRGSPMTEVIFKMRTFVEWAQNEIAVVPDFHKRIFFSDEAHFWLNGYDNKQNCRIWSEANPQVYVDTPLHPEKLIVWYALWDGGILLQKR